jgi:hypothetical protein
MGQIVISEQVAQNMCQIGQIVTREQVALVIGCMGQIVTRRKVACCMRECWRGGARLNARSPGLAVLGHLGQIVTPEKSAVYIKITFHQTYYLT